MNLKTSIDQVPIRSDSWRFVRRAIGAIVVGGLAYGIYAYADRDTAADMFPAPPVVVEVGESPSATLPGQQVGGLITSVSVVKVRGN